MAGEPDDVVEQHRGRSVPAWVVAAALAAVYLVVDPPSADLAAQTYRTWLFEHHGWAIWDNGWYSGHHLPAYSVLFPPLAALLGPRVVGALSAVVAAWAFERLVDGEGDGARPAALWFAVATSVSLVTGRLTFALGLAFALLAALALARNRPALAAAAAFAAALASPVAAAFLALAVVAWAITARRWVTAAVVLAAAAIPALALTIAFPEGGEFPFEADAFLPTLLGATLLLLVVLPKERPALRLGVALYAVLLLAGGLVETPMGGNAARLGALVAGPIAVLALWPRHRRVLLLLVPLLAYWQWSTPVDDWRQAHDDPSADIAYYDGVLGFLDAQAARDAPFRVEIPFTDNHWEASYVARHVPLARGWERQLDRKVNALFYDDAPLTPERYRVWLDENAVRFVALADAPVDPSAAEEAALVRDGDAPYLQEVWHDAHWRVFAVDDPAPMATGAARATAIATESVDLLAARAGEAGIRVRWTPYWRLTRGAGCVEPDGDWTRVRLSRPGQARLEADFAPSRIRATTPRCTE